MAYRYYSILRPISLGTFPEQGVILFENYNSRIPVKAINRLAWGHLDYNRKLSDKEADNYDLVFGGEV